MPNDDSAGGLDRRRFLALAALAGLGVMSRAEDAAAQAPAPPPAAVAPPAASDAPSEDARAIVGVLQRRYENRLSAEQWESVVRDVDGDLAAGKRLRSARLVNADEPDIVFEA